MGYSDLDQMYSLVIFSIFTKAARHWRWSLSPQDNSKCLNKIDLLSVWHLNRSGSRLLLTFLDRWLKRGYIEKYVNIIYALGSAHVKFDGMNRSWSFAVLFHKPSRIGRQSRPTYKSAVPNWFIRRTLHAPNLIIGFGTCKVWRLNRA